METRFVDNLGTWRTFFKISDGPILTSPTPATVVKEPSAVAIFLLLGHGKYVVKPFGEWVIWFVAPESMTQELAKVLPETFNPIEVRNTPEYANEQVHEGLSRLPIRDLTLSTSSWLRLPNSCSAASFCCTAAT
jgi:hypothetical protein